MLIPDSLVVRFFRVAKTLIPSITEMISPNSAKQMLNARMIPKASLNQGVLNTSCRAGELPSGNSDTSAGGSWARFHYKLGSLGLVLN